MQSQTESPARPWTILDIVTWTTAYFKSHDIDSPRATAEILLAHVLHVRRIDLYLRYDQPLTPNELSAFKALIQKRVKREPVAYILGAKEFWSMDFCVSSQCLIPRPETECLVEKALSILPETVQRDEDGAAPAILELGTGSGAIIIAIARERPGRLFYASDYSLETVLLARKNAEAHRLGDQIHFFVGDWLSPLSHSACFEMIVSNPPYIQTDLLNSLQPEIRHYEPRIALDGGKDGLGCVRRIVHTAYRHLNPGGVLVLEIGSDQKEAVVHLVQECGGYEDAVITKDYGGLDRVAVVRKR